mmetsp:Transcript_18225/g.26948  ORF Transcript_18225/g.26948 Transcript_18225/m.26948 type:complete len:486 (-) Transcript_18225:35-1492(-)
MEHVSAPRKYAEKEAFVTGHDGTTALEIFLLCLAVPIGLRLYSKLTSCVSHTNKRYYWIEIAIEIATLILPNLLLQTSLLPYIIGPSVLHLIMSILSFILPPHHKQSHQNKINNNNIINRPPFLTVHRATIYIQTAIAILAVDFPIFPRRYCKTEIGGYGWMDLGAASFIIIAGWSSSSSPSTASNNMSTMKSMKKAVIKCAPLLVLGIIRLITIKGVEYQEHVSEYGVHWNFFFTLCCVEGSMVVWKHVKGRYFSLTFPWDGMLACLLMMVYQLYLSIGGGQDFIENGPRQCSSDDSSWLSLLCSAFVANREGILGIIGYLSLRLLSESMARYCIWPKVDPNTITELRQWRLLIASVAFWATHFFLTLVLGVSNSRRSTNVPFILWSMAQNTSVLCLIHFAMTSMGEPVQSAPRIFNSINRFGLPVFFVSNILTGLVNLLVDTIHSSNEKAMLVLSIYLMAVCALSQLLDNLFDKKRAADKKVD